MKSWKIGSCHCGKVRFKVFSDFEKGQLCNCSICTKKAFLHLIVGKKDFELISGQDCLSTYTFGTHTAQHHFCKFCGISSFYVPRSHPDGYSVNYRCIDGVDISQVEFENFDGQNWEENIHLLKI